MSRSMRSRVLPMSNIEVIVVTGVSPAISMCVVLSSMGFRVIFMFEGYDRKAPFVFRVMW